MKNQPLHRLLMSPSTFLWAACFVLHFGALSQTTNISGVINTYHRVMEVIPAKACVRVSSTAGLAASAKVMLVQMKGGSLNTTSNSTAFGDTISLNNAGNYEIGTICAIIGDSVFLVHNILNSYTATTGKVQLVKFGEYVSANITGAITAPPWDNTTGTGGVIAIFAEQDITMNDDIDADATGFRGGAFAQSNTVCNNSFSSYFYDGVPTFIGQTGAYKGEGIAEATSGINAGRGAFGNGGGGGNNHNNGGGGGSNLNTGGRGGGNSTNPGVSNCNASYPGEAGKALSSWNGQKIFFGGGGGAGHNNNAVTTTPGANGGGIIFIHAANLIGNGREITATGGKGGNSQADGAGGGGGGGTIIMDVAAYSGALTIKADGGAGGDSNDGLNIGRCYGAGGGGGGGVIYFSGSSPAAIITSNAGAAGLEYNREATCVAPQFPNAGNNGQVINSYAYRASSTLAAYCGVILPVRITFFKAVGMEKKVMLHWQLPNPESVRTFIIQRADANNEWTTLASMESNYTRQDYSTDDRDPLPGYNSYRILMIGNNNSVSYSSIRRVFVNMQKGMITVFPNPATDKITVKSSLSGQADMKLVDLSGKIVWQKQGALNHTLFIHLPGLPAGVYALHINETVTKLSIR